MIMVLEAFLAPGSELWMFNEVPEKDREKKLTDGGLDISGLVNLKLVHREGNAVIRRHLESLPLETFDSNTAFQQKIYPSRLSSMTIHSRSASSPHGSLAKLELSDGNSLYAKLVVGADGSKSRVKELAGINSTGWKCSQNAIICIVEHMEENHCAWQRFLPNGPIALLPIGDNFSNIVWTMTPEESLNRKSMSEVDFVREIDRALDNGYGPHPNSQLFGGRAAFSWLTGDTTVSTNECFEVPPRVTKVASERMVFPLSLNHATSYALKRVVLIGDAAHTVHPLAGQGVNMGFGDAFSL